MREKDGDLLRTTNGCASSVTIASSRVKHSCADAGVFAARTSQKGDDVGSYKRTMVHHDLSSK